MPSSSGPGERRPDDRPPRSLLDVAEILELAELLFVQRLALGGRCGRGAKTLLPGEQTAPHHLDLERLLGREIGSLESVVEQAIQLDAVGGRRVSGSAFRSARCRNAVRHEVIASHRHGERAIGAHPVAEGDVGRMAFAA